MSRLAEAQAAIATAMLSGDCTHLPASLTGGGREATARCEIHLRHYRESLTSTLVQKFPATVWLLGEGLLTRAAQEFIRGCPPRTPCIAEYGYEFPEFLGQLGSTEPYPYVKSFARLDWLLGKAAIAVDKPPLYWDEIAVIAPDVLLDTRVTLQPGLRLLRANHAVDELMQLYLSGNEPEQYSLTRAESLIEITGSRGRFRIAKLDPGRFVFRHALRAGSSIGEAASAAVDADFEFDAGQALRDLVGAGLIVATAPTRGSRR